METQINIVDNVVIVTAIGKLMGGPETTDCHNKIKDLINKGYKNVIVDLSKAEWINSRGMGSLMACHTSLQRSNGNLIISGSSEKTKSLLKMTKLDTVIQCFNNLEDAISYFKE